jgi:hypothetical protein
MPTPACATTSEPDQSDGVLIEDQQPGISDNFLPLLTKNFCFSSAHYAETAKLANAQTVAVSAASIAGKNDKIFRDVSENNPIFLEDFYLS